MKYLLIDFGASFIKSCRYDSISDKIDLIKSVSSPFSTGGTTSKDELISYINSIIQQYPDCKKVMSCSILGGEWIDDVYYSWKVIKSPSKPDCLISKIFSNQTTYHIHSHHGGTTQEIKPLGYFGDVLFYSSLGDTFCVIEHMNIQDNEYIINIGTGSQVITKTDIHKYIPAGRALSVFANFFNGINIDIYEKIQQLSIVDVLESSLEIDLNVFEQSFAYKNGGCINYIQENNFTINNLLGSILKCLVCQYKPFIKADSYVIKLTGGIPKKIPLIKKIFEYYYPNPIIYVDTDHETHMGLSKFIQHIKEK